MAADEAKRETAAVRQEVAAEREQLVQSVEALRDSTDITAQLRSKLALALGGAFAAGFVLSGGIGATMRLLFRRGREGRTAARTGRFKIVVR